MTLEGFRSWGLNLWFKVCGSLKTAFHGRIPSAPVGGIRINDLTYQTPHEDLNFAVPVGVLYGSMVAATSANHTFSGNSRSSPCRPRSRQL